MQTATAVAMREPPSSSNRLYRNAPPAQEILPLLVPAASTQSILDAIKVFRELSIHVLDEKDFINLKGSVNTKRDLPLAESEASTSGSSTENAMTFRQRALLISLINSRVVDQDERELALTDLEGFDRIDAHDAIQSFLNPRMA